MAVRVIPKRNASPSVAPQPDELEIGEIAINTHDGVLYTKLAGGEVRQLNTRADDTTITDRIADLEDRLDDLTKNGGMLAYGSWTPVIVAIGANAVQPTLTYENQQGVYSRIGPTVTVNGRVRFTSSGGSATALAIDGLPFPHTVTREGNAVVKMRGAGVIGFAGGSSAVKPLTAWGAGGTQMILGKVVDGTDNDTSITYYAPSDANGVIDIIFTYTYQTSYE